MAKVFLVSFMAKIRISWIGLSVWLAALSLCGQTTTNLSTNTFTFAIAPANGKIMVEGTTNVVSATLADWANFTNLFGNIKITATAGASAVTLADKGSPPDATAADGVFTGNLITPLVPAATNFTFRVVISADDLTMTNENTADITNIVTVTVTNQAAFIIVPRPLNDKLAKGTKIGSPVPVVVTGTNNYASLEASEPQHGGVQTDDASVWWIWSASTNGNVLIDTAGSSFNTVLGVYSGPTTNVAALVPVAGAAQDTANKLKAHVNFTATLGTTYYIAVAGATSNDVGNVRLRIVPGGYPDTNGPVVTITSPADGKLFTTNLVRISGTAYDPNADASGLSQVFVKVNSASPTKMTGTDSWSGNVTLIPGTNLLQAYAVDIAGNTGAVSLLNLWYVNPTNDLFTSAIRLTGSSGSDIAINGRATKEPGEPLHGLNEGGHSIWYSWKAPANGTLHVTTQGSDFDTLLGLYTGDSVTNLTTIASNDDVFPGSLYSVVDASVKKDVVYYVAVDGFGGQSGTIKLAFNFTPTSDFFNLTITPPLGGSVTPASGAYLANTNLVLVATPDTDYAFVKWTGSLDSTANPLNLTLSNTMTLTAQFRVQNYTDTFESGKFDKLPWTFSGNAPWLIVSSNASSGRFAARSGVIDNSQRSSLILTTNTLEGTGSFDLRVSSESGFDFLEFYLNGQLLKKWSGEVSWRNYQFQLLTGRNTLEWRYTKDANFSEGEDAAYIDNLYLPMVAATNQPAQLSIALSTNNQVRVTVTGQANRAYVVQTSTNLKTWTSVATNLSDTSTSYWMQSTTNTPYLFFRALSQ
jgi:hypothetical protein